MSDPSEPARERELGPALAARLAALLVEGRRLAACFDDERRGQAFHPFQPGDYGDILAFLLAARTAGTSFLELGSGTGVVTVMADMLGMDACGIEADAALVQTARDLAARFASSAHFAAGSFFPDGYVFRNTRGEGHLGTLTGGPSGYTALRRDLGSFDVVYGYPWPGEAPVMRDLMQRCGRRGALLLLHGYQGGIEAYRDDVRQD